MTYYKMDFERDYNGYYKCNEEGTFYCSDSHECPLCINGQHISSVRQMWRRLLAENRPERMFLPILDAMNDEQFEQLLDWEFSRQSNPHNVFHFDQYYEEISRQLPQRYDTVIDFGCSVGLQSFLFGNVRYIGVDVFYLPGVGPELAEFYQIPAQDFIAQYAQDFDQYSTLAVCLHVPDAEARQAVADNFENNIIVYNGA